MANLPLQSLKARGNNSNVINKVTIISNLTNKQIVAACLKTQNLNPNKPVYLVGAISSLNLMGVKISLPHNWHYRLRQTFKTVATTMLQNKIWACNPASIKVFGRHIKANKNLYNNTPLWAGPVMANKVFKVRGKYTFKSLQRFNKMYARCASSIVLVNAPLALYSNGVQQELAFALKHNPTCKVYKWQQNIGPMAGLIKLTLNQLKKLGCIIVK